MLRRSDANKRIEAISCLGHQIMFFLLCEHWFCPTERLTGLYSLLFYHIFGYVITNAHRLFSVNSYLPEVNLSEQTDMSQLARTATKILLDFTKAVTFVITGIFMLLVFGLDQGLEHYKPTQLYVFITLVYFLITEQTCQAKASLVLAWFQLEYFENHEDLWCPVLLRLMSSMMSAIMLVLVWFATDGGWILVFGSSYANIYLCLKEMEQYWTKLVQGKELLERFRLATCAELEKHEDVCPVCLQAMKYARITPCNHLFHGACLERCLKERMVCPFCKHLL